MEEKEGRQKENLKREIEALDEEIDEKIYRIYSISDSERKIIKKSLGQE